MTQVLNYVFKNVHFEWITKKTLLVSGTTIYQVFLSFFTIQALFNFHQKSPDRIIKTAITLNQNVSQFRKLRFHFFFFWEYELFESIKNHS